MWGVALGAADGKAEQVAESADVSASGEGLIQYAVLADGLGRPLWATAHPVGEPIPGNAVRLEELLGEPQINGIGQNSQGLFGEFGESCPAQHFRYILPGTLHCADQLPLPFLV